MPPDYEILQNPNDPNLPTKHHRLPQSLGGTWDTENISEVPNYKHQAWHRLFDNLPAQEVVVLLRGYYEVFGIDNPKSPLQTKINEGWANANSGRIKNREAWYSLFGGLTVNQIEEEVNSVWLDPAYSVIIGLERVYKINLVSNKSQKGAR